MSVVRKALFFPTICYNVVVDTLTTKTWYNRIDEHIVLGALPFRLVLPRLKNDENIAAIISMNQDFELSPHWYPTHEELREMEIELLRLPVEDYTGVPTQEQIEEGIQFIDKVIENSTGRIYVHCKAGRSRSAILTAAYLISKQGMNVEEACDHLKSIRRQVWIGPKGRESLQAYHEVITKKISE